ncbi:sensor histidine kinase [Kitasatospora sp. NPDC086009]|uniref:sensor histidine kinase n=1 Tax=unclassified Kitasatospora TaxID=2633591 RepID=UPI0037CAAE64
MTTGTAPRRLLTLALRRAPWSVRVWRDIVFLCLGVPLQLASFSLVAVPWLLFVEPADDWLYWPLETTQLMLTVVGPLAFLLLSVTALNEAQHRRFRYLLGESIPRAAHSTIRLSWRGLATSVRSQAAWRQLGYHVLVGPVLGLAGLAVLAGWLYAIALAGAYGWIWALPEQVRQRAAVFTAGGLLLVLVMPWVTALVVGADGYLARRLLGPSRAERLAERVDDLTEGRNGLVAAADAERRRIERDLHDGTQQRLVALAMTLGLARATLTDAGPNAKGVIDKAHREALEAIAELKHVVRGLHPAVLDDRGLDAALSGVAARAPLPVDLAVTVDRRPATAIESVAYFVVAEALNNVAKHARAERAAVRVDRVADLLRVVVTDDGVGGADQSRGTGIAGLSRRARSVDGTFRISSPVGGPTTITVELPCAS